MPELIEFQEAIARTEGEDRSLLIGNGFSAEYFSYKSLLEKSGLRTDSPVREIFSALQTVDFEMVVRALENAAIVEGAYGNVTHSKALSADAQLVREALVHAINSTHPKHREELNAQYESSATFLENFTTVFTLNYDLLLYWVRLEKARLSDGFGLGSRRNGFIKPFIEGAHCNVYNVHGGLHLFETATGEVEKALDEGAGVISTITRCIVEGNRFPIYVAEGTSSQKMRKISSVAYLRHCYEMLEKNSATLFIYGHSADDNDAHIYQAIFGSDTKRLYFGVHKPDTEKLQAFDGILAKYQKSLGSDMEYTFFDSESANIWSTD